jgi:galactose-1-phosphate uridylyltransferase
MYSQKVNMLDELKSGIIAAIADVTKDILQNIWQEVGCKWNIHVCRATDGTQCEVFHTQHLFHLCVKKMFQLMNKNTANNTLISVFVCKIQVPEIQGFFRP